MNHAHREPLVVAIEARIPAVDPATWVAPTAAVVGGVTLGPGANVWYGAVLRADDEEVTVGRDTNIQDGAVLHADRATRAGSATRSRSVTAPSCMAPRSGPAA